MTVLWSRVVFFFFTHVGALYGAFLIVAQAKWFTILWVLLLWVLSGLGITAGAHRLWSHRSFKAAWPLRLFLMLCNCMALQSDVISWARTHRCHHKWSETDADPHNSKRGFFFSHMGWILLDKHPQREEKEKQVTVQDLMDDSLLVFQKRHYIPLVLLLCCVIPTLVPVFLWSETVRASVCTCVFFRYIWLQHATWTVNSFAHRHGYRPYDKYIEPRQNSLSIWATLGEGWHNYHHSFPQDYRASEFAWKINLTTMFIDFCAQIGMVYDRKIVSDLMIEHKKQRTGDKSN